LKETEPAVAEGKIKYKEDITDGLENAIDCFTGMLEGKNFGKAIIKVADE
jgi:NADPH-dependent curcumin reductase CurA